MISKLAIGTVQFGLDYGINNKRGKIPKEEVFEILNTLQKHNIDTLDTAISYGDSEKVLGEYEKITEFKIVSKFSNLNQIKDQIAISLKNLKVEKLYGYLSHSFDDFKNNIDKWQYVLSLKEEGKVEKVGFSLYKTQELDFILDKEIYFDIVQLPYSILDQRFEPYFKHLKHMNVEIHTRSAFLQGALLMENIPDFMSPIKEKIDLINKISTKNNISKLSFLLSFCIANEYIDKVVIGIDGMNHLKQILSINFEKTLPILKSINKELFKTNDEKIILPYNWNKK